MQSNKLSDNLWQSVMIILLLLCIISGFLYFELKIDKLTPNTSPAPKAEQVATVDSGVIPSEGIEITVDYDVSLPDAIRAAGYERVGPGLVEAPYKDEVKKRGKEKIAMKIFSFGRERSFQNVVSVMEAHGCRPATLRELVAYNQVGPAYQEGLMIALGSPTKDGYVPQSFMYVGITQKREPQSLGLIRVRSTHESDQLLAVVK